MGISEGAYGPHIRRRTFGFVANESLPTRESVLISLFED